MSAPSPAAQLRRMLGHAPVVTAGAYDCISARAIEEAGFAAIYTSGFGIAAGFLGQPDTGLYTMTENLALVRQIVVSVKIPVLADVDTAYGGPLNVTRTVQEFEQAGCAGVVLEDQQEPKRCPLIGGDVVSGLDAAPLADSLAKLQAALDARRDPDFLIVARTDTQGDETRLRAAAYLEAGADLVLPITRSFSTAEELRDFAQQVGGRAGVNVAGWILERCTVSELAGLGFQLMNFALLPVMIAAHALRTALPSIRIDGAGPDRPYQELRLDNLEAFLRARQELERAAHYAAEGARLASEHQSR